MGLDTSCKDVIRKQFGWPAMPIDQKFSVVIDDLLINMHKVLTGVSSWEQVGNRLRDRVEYYVRSGTVEEYWVMWDERAFVPPNKSITQTKRVEQKKAVPFTSEELANITVGVTPVPEEAKEFFSRLMATSQLVTHLYVFAAAELALADIGTTTRLILDGARAHGIFAHQVNGAAVRVTGVPLPKHPLEVMPGPREALLLDQKRLYISRGEDGVNQVTIIDSRRVGESDFKIPAIIAEQDAGAIILVRSCDTDMLTILLLHMRNYVCTNTMGEGTTAYGWVKHAIYLDTAGRAPKQGSPVVPKLAMPELWRAVLKTFMAMFPAVTEPIETLSVLFLLSGSDYADRFPRIGAATVWKAFCDPVGQRILFPLDRRAGPLVHMDDIRGQPTARINIGIDEVRMWRFVAFIYHKLVLKKAPFPETGVYSLERARTVQAAKVEVVRASGKDLTSANSWMPPSDDKISAGVRRLAWNLDYLVNGSKRSLPFRDPTELSEMTGESLYGWTRVHTKDADGKPTEKSHIEPASRVSDPAHGLCLAGSA